MLTGTGAWRVSNNTWPSDEAYYGHRFTNGPVWVEYLAELLGMELDDNAVGGGTLISSSPLDSSVQQAYLSAEIQQPAIIRQYKVTLVCIPQFQYLLSSIKSQPISRGVK